jgi:hypothetical protein
MNLAKHLAMNLTMNLTMNTAVFPPLHPEHPSTGA